MGVPAFNDRSLKAPFFQEPKKDWNPTIMANNSLNISIPLKFEIKSPPLGMTDYDPKTLSPEQQTELNMQKLSVRKENIVYLAKNPEVRALVSMIIRRTIIHQPQNVVEFVAKMFTRPEKCIRQDIYEIMQESDIEYEPIPYCDCEIWDY